MEVNSSFSSFKVYLIYLKGLGFIFGTSYSLCTQNATLHEHLPEETTEFSKFGTEEEICMQKVTFFPLARPFRKYFLVHCYIQIVLPKMKCAHMSLCV